MIGCKPAIIDGLRTLTTNPGSSSTVRSGIRTRAQTRYNLKLFLSRGNVFDESR